MEKLIILKKELEKLIDDCDNCCSGCEHYKLCWQFDCHPFYTLLVIENLIKYYK